MSDVSNPQIAMPLSMEDKASFDTFYAGENQELVAALRNSICRADPKLVYFYGPEASGKSHLMYAAMRLASEEVINISYLPLSDPYIAPPMLQMVDVAHVVCVDDIQFWKGLPEKEQALFSLFERIKLAGGILIISARLSPDSQGFSLRDLTSRLSSGLIYPLEPLDEEGLSKALQLRAHSKGLVLNDKAINYMTSRMSRDPHAVFQLLDQIDKASLVEKRRITIPFLQTIMKP